ncbi:unnamed protein product [Albugo candida]|uniref:Uncharacterized protein n=1 Tax=Albugo candida TaxID=65357 RepID=A0A024G3I3_9STRA|nr:unnamed protein product [Albugo candida]|eukprot:CCI41236.1 unnamed protein product [Albugo candida]
MPVLRDAPVAVQTHSEIRPFLDIIPFEMLSTIWVHRQAMAHLERGQGFTITYKIRRHNIFSIIARIVPAQRKETICGSKPSFSIILCCYNNRVACRNDEALSS